MTQEATIYQISSQGLEDLKSEVWNLNDIDKIGIRIVTGKFKGSRVANIMYITLNSMDLYDVKICKYRNLEVKVVDEIENCYNDDLVPFFEKTTGLRTSL